MADMKTITPFDYAHLLTQVKQRVKIAQQRAVYAANGELLHMYWDIGNLLHNAQQLAGWGKGTLKQLEQDLKNEYPEVKGFSVRNCQCMIQFYQEYNQQLTLPKQPENTQLAVAQLSQYNFELPILHLSWTHNIILIQRVKDIKARYWYMIQILTNH